MIHRNTLLYSLAIFTSLLLASSQQSCTPRPNPNFECWSEALLTPKFKEINIYTGNGASNFVKDTSIRSFPRLRINDKPWYGYIPSWTEHIKIVVDTVNEKRFRKAHILIKASTSKKHILEIPCGLQWPYGFAELLGLKLKEKGYYSGKIPLWVTPELNNSMMKYQYDHNVPVGFVSDALYESLSITKQNMDSLIYIIGANEYNYLISIKADSDSLSNEDSILLFNPSFEQKPTTGGELYYNLIGWKDCGRSKFPKETPVDILPNPDTIWQITIPAHHGGTYVGMSTRENKTWESVSQDLPVTLNQENCYSISFALCQSEKFISGVRWNPNISTNFNAPTKLRIWGGIDYCQQQELLIETDPISSHNWETWEYTMKPSCDIRSLTFEAFYADEHQYRNGHILLDNISVIRKVECKED